jgi:hypothetical protein
MKQHDRTLKVQKARIEIDSVLFDLRRKHGLTSTEYFGILVESMATDLKFMLRIERHPEDSSQPADCE